MAPVDISLLIVQVSRDFYLTTENTHMRQTFATAVGLEHEILATTRPPRSARLLFTFD